MKRALATLWLTAGCSLAFPLSEYEEGGTSPASGGSGGAGTAAAGGGGVAGGGAAAGGDGGAGAECGTFSNSGTSDVTFDFEEPIPPVLVPSGGCISYDAGEVVFSPAAVGDYCWLELAGSRHLACDTFAVRVSDPGSQELGMQRFIYIRQIGGEGALNLLQEVGGFNLEGIGEAPYDPSRDFWWRLRATDTMLYFDTSEDGVRWTERIAGVPPFPLDEVSIQFGAGMWGFVENPGQARFDCVNLPGACP